MTIVIRRAEQADIAPISSHLRREDADEVLAEGNASVEEALERSFEASPICSTVVIDGVPVAMFGIVPDVLAGTTARIWLLGAEGLRAIPKTFVKGSRVVVARWLGMYPVLWNRVDTRYTKTIRWLRSLGAVFMDSAPTGPAGMLFQTFIIRRA